VLSSDWLTQGPLSAQFESAICATTGARHAIACSSGTTALHLAALCLGWGPGDVVLVPAITFLATANCCVYVGAEPFFVDVDPVTCTIDVDEVERHVKALRAAGRRVRGVIGVDMAGHPCDWQALRTLGDRYELDLVDDASHALGAAFADGVRIGSGGYADITTLSFHPVKHITTGEGGAVLTDDAAVAERARRMRSHGVLRGEDEVADWEGPWHYDMVDLGYNYRLTDIQCALGLSQLHKLDEFLTKRRWAADRYRALFSGAPALNCPVERPGVEHAYHLFVLRVQFDLLGVSRRELFEHCRARGVMLQVHYRPLVSNSFYRELAIRQGADRHLPSSFAYYEEAVSLPLFPQLTGADLTRVAETLGTALGVQIESHLLSDPVGRFNG
jgi:perosamine synthetase